MINTLNFNIISEIIVQDLIENFLLILSNKTEF